MRRSGRTLSAVLGTALVGLACVAAGSLAGANDERQSTLDELIEAGAIEDPHERRTPEMDALLREIEGLTVDDDSADVATMEGRPSGYTSHIVNDRTGSVTIHWQGDVPDVVERLSSRHPDISVSIVNSEYSLLEQVEAVESLMKNLDSELLGRGEITMAGPKPDGSGIEVGVRTSDDDLTADEVLRAISRLTPMRVELTIGDEVAPAPLIGTRQDDTSPFYGGAGIDISGTSGTYYCSTGFSVVGLTSGNKYMTTAFHCIDAAGGRKGVSTRPLARTWANGIGLAQAWRRTAILL